MRRKRSDMSSKKYIHQLKKWPSLQWNQEVIYESLMKTKYKQGLFLGRIQSLGFRLQEEALLQTLTYDVVKTSEIEGENLNHEQVRSSVARRLGIKMAGLVHSTRDVDGVVAMMVDATQYYDQKLTERRLFQWHSFLFPTGNSGLSQIRVGQWRNDVMGPMQVVSGSIGKERVHFEAPAASRVSKEMKKFIQWFHSPKNQPDLLLKAGLSHIYFLTIHPFDDGNGRIARAITDLTLANAENSSKRFYSMSSQICKDRKGYYDILEKTQRGTLDVTEWLLWFLECLDRSIQGSEEILELVLTKAHFWEKHKNQALNDRQRKILNKLLDGFEGKLTSSKWSILGKCSQDTAARDIDDLIKKNILKKNPEGGRSTSYSLILETKSVS